MSEKVGRILSVKRVMELNSKDWFYKMLKDNPELVKVYPSIENRCLEDGIDHHIHAYPDFVYRAQDMIEVAMDASKAKMRALGFKDHYHLTSGCAYLTQKYIEEMIKKGFLENKVDIYGGYCLNLGVNVDAVKIALKYPNTKMIWFPTFNSAGYLRGAGKDPSKGVFLVDKNGRVLSDVEEIMNLATEAKVGIGLGHTDFKELLPLAEKAKEIGARAVLDHPLLELNKLTIEEIKQLADLGVYVGTYCQPMIPSLYQPVCDPFETVEVIKEVGAERCIIGSDFGQVLHINSIDGTRICIRALLGFGIKEAEIEMMFKKNPTKLLYLE